MTAMINIGICMEIILEYFSFFYIIFRKSVRKPSWKLAVFGGMMCALCIGMDWLHWDIQMVLWFGVLFSVLVVYELFGLSLAEVVKLYLVAFPSLSILELLGDGFVKVVFQMEGVAAIALYVGYIIVGLWLYYLALGRKLERDAFLIPGKLWIVMSCLLFLMAGMVSLLLFLLRLVRHTTTVDVGFIMVMLGGTAIFVLNYTMLYHFNTRQKYAWQMELLEHYNGQQREYFEQLLKKEQSTRQFRHDLISELLQLQNFCQKNEYDALQQYLSEMLREITVVSKENYDVGNEIVNTVLNSYFAPIKHQTDIKVKGFLDNELNISRRDLCIIVSNLVKNAVEGVAACQSRIVFELEQGKRFVHIKVANTVADQTFEIKNGLPVTGKENRREHGFGIQNIMIAAEKYGGTYEYRVENGYYIAEVYLKN